MNLNKNKFKEIVNFGNKTFGFLKMSEMKLSPNNIRPSISKEEAEIIKVTLLPSIDAIGLQQLPVCTPEGEIFVGGRRSKAYELKGEQWLPVEIRDSQPYDQMRDSWAENRARKDVQPLEEARHLKKMKDAKKLSNLALAQEMGLSKGYVDEKLNMLEAFGERHGVAIIRGKGTKKEKKQITEHKAQALSREWVEPEVREKIIETIKTEGMTEEQVQKRIGDIKVIKTMIETEEKPEVKAKLEKEFSGEKILETSQQAVLDRQRELKNLEPLKSKDERPIDEFLEGEEVEIKVSPKVMSKITKFYLDKKGRYIGTKVLVQGEVARSEKD